MKPHSLLAPLVLAALLVAVGAPARAQGDAPSRGRLLYENHCGACHGVQMHWRDKKLVTDRASLAAEVRRWQAAAHLGWSEDEIVDVARHLDDTVYHFGKSATRGAPRPLAAR